MPTVEEFRALLVGAVALDIVDRILIDNTPVHVSADLINYIRKTIAISYQVDPSEVSVLITGSANLGFSLAERKRNGVVLKSRYRAFSAQSDIDVAVISATVFHKLWSELSGYSHRQSYFPWRSERLGDYLVCGWLRPDHFPKNVRLRECDRWFDTFNRISRDPRSERRQVNGGMFQSLSFLKQYMSRAVEECIRLENEK